MDPVVLSSLGIAACNLLIAGLCVPMWLGWVPPNGIYGFRTPRTLTDPKVWYAANRVAGRSMTIGASVAAVACGLGPLLPLAPDTALMTLVAVDGVVLFAAIAHAFWGASVVAAELDGLLATTETKAAEEAPTSARSRVDRRSRESDS